MDCYDAIVIGLGAMGSAVTLELAQRGVKVLALEQFQRGHQLGSSHGQTRIIRKAYFEHPSYVPLVCRSYEKWYDLEQRSGLHLLTQCPCLSLGKQEGELIQGVLASSRQHQLPVEFLSRKELEFRYPVFQAPQDCVGVLEHSAGFLKVEDSLQAMQIESLSRGAVLKEEEPVLNWETVGETLQLQTSRGHYQTRRLIMTAGPWARRILSRWNIPLKVMRQIAWWFKPKVWQPFRRDQFPLFIAETGNGYFYGFPALDPLGMKVAQHYGATESGDPDEINRSVSMEEEEPVRTFLRDWLPLADGPRERSSVCIYTLTPDRHFILDRHPEISGVIMGVGFSGHGFKFAPLIGEVLADLVLEGSSRWPIDLFRLNRFDNPKQRNC